MATSAESAAVAMDGHAIKVGSQSKPRATAGALAARLRTIGSTDAIAIGALAVNQCLKSVISARKYLNEDPAPRDTCIRVSRLAVGPDAVQLVLERRDGVIATPAVPAEDNFRVTSETKLPALAGAIAGKARTGTKVLSIVGVGPTAVLKMLKAIAAAQGYLTDDKIEIYFVPRFIEVALPARKTAGATAGESSGASATPGSTEDRIAVCLDAYLEARK